VSRAQAQELTDPRFARFSVMNNYQAAAQAGFPPASPHGAGGHGGPQGRSFPAANSPGPIDLYGSSAVAAAAAAAADSAVASYVQATASPQPPTTAFPAIAVSRAPINYSPVSRPRLATTSAPSSPRILNGSAFSGIPCTFLLLLTTRNDTHALGRIVRDNLSTFLTATLTILDTRLHARVTPAKYFATPSTFHPYRPYIS
jgi:hypothetical protein